MLKKENRLNKKADFDRVFKKGKSFYSKKIGVKIMKNGLSVSRFGLIVSTKVAKKSTKRNRLKRRLREIIRLRIDKIKKGYDFMIITLSGSAELKYRQLEQEIEVIFKQLGAFV